MKLKSLDTADVLRVDTLPVPNDRLTEKIKELRKERSGLTIETMINIKLMEEGSKNNSIPKEYYDRLRADLLEGRSHRLMENSIINLYRRTYTKKEIGKLLKFYKTSAGKKLDKEYLFLMVESAKDAEKIMSIAGKLIMDQMKSEGKIKQ
jgi:hypothetical protein